MRKHFSAIFFILFTSLLAVGSAGKADAQNGNLQVSFINVGYGDATLIRDPSGFDVLIDGGQRSASTAVIEYLHDQGVDDIEVMVVTHAHSDAYGGLIDVLELDDIPVESVIYNGYPGTGTWNNFVEAVASEGLTLTSAQYPQIYTWGSIKAQILNPEPDVSEPRPTETNDRSIELQSDANDPSIVILLEYGEVRFLIASDIAADIEQAILSRNVPLSAEILKVPYHGSSNASSDAFLDAVQPEQAIISVGQNRYDHPGNETLARLGDAGAQIWRTDIDGTIIVESDGKTYTVDALGITATSTEIGATETSPAEITATPTATPAPILQPLILWFQEKQNQPWFKPLSTLGGFLIILVTGILALLLWASQVGSAIFDRYWLISLAAKPLLITPGLGRWALFLGYRQRLKAMPLVDKASRDYFGLPALDPSGALIKPDPQGDALHDAIATTLDSQSPVLLLGRGGAGKSTLLARWVHLYLVDALPENLRGYRVILVTPAYYRGNLIRAIASVLRERDGVAATEDMMRAQLGSGKYLVLFDGVSEVEGDKAQALSEILQTARNADYRRCRFLIATRPLESTQFQVNRFELQPLTGEVIQDLLPRYGLGTEREFHLRQQLKSFGESAIEPLLLAMMLDQSETGEISRNRAQLYERYFRRLLRVEAHENWWRGWRRALEVMAQWFMLDTGRRGVGLPREPFLQRMLSQEEAEWPNSENLVALLQEYYELPVERALELLTRLQSAGILVEERRWRFAHDTFEEYFAASRIVSIFSEYERWPEVSAWMDNEEQVLGFLDILAFAREMEKEEFCREMSRTDIPAVWRDTLLGKTIMNQSEGKMGGGFTMGSPFPFEPEMVPIPGGPFLMGSSDEQIEQVKQAERGKGVPSSEAPQHSLELLAYQIAKYPITNSAYQAFVLDAQYTPPRHWVQGVIPKGKSDHPVVNITWHDAVAYCRWLAEKSGKSYRLPSEAEWEKAARGDDGRIYPWGDEFDPKKCNTAESHIFDTTPVSQYSPQGDSPYGCADMSGNVREWTRSLYEAYPYVSEESREDLESPGRRVLRSCSFEDFHADARCAARYWNYPYYEFETVGFRVVVSQSPLPPYNTILPALPTPGG